MTRGRGANEEYVWAAKEIGALPVAISEQLLDLLEAKGACTPQLLLELSDVVLRAMMLVREGGELHFLAPFPSLELNVWCRMAQDEHGWLLFCDVDNQNLDRGEI